MTINMKMPKSCSQCRFEGMYNRRLDGYECFALLDYVPAENHCLKRDDECPLKEQKEVDRICRTCGNYVPWGKSPEDSYSGQCSLIDLNVEDCNDVPATLKACSEWKERD